MIKPMSRKISPMLCQELEINDVVKENGMDEVKVTRAYRKAIAEALKRLMAEGFVGERKS